VKTNTDITIDTTNIIVIKCTQISTWGRINLIRNANGIEAYGACIGNIGAVITGRRAVMLCDGSKGRYGVVCR